jgi:hypothetical protein
MVLEVGCGPRSRSIPGTVGIDLIDFGQKYVGDFLTYEFKDKFEMVYAHHVIEHLPDTVAFFNKVGEILDIGGVLDVRVPTMPYEQCFWDPTHVKFIYSPVYFQYFTNDSPAGHCYSVPVFKIDYEERDRYEWESHVKMTRIK